MFSQQYPRWFLEQGKYSSCSPLSVGIVKTSYYSESTIASGVRKGCEVYVTYKESRISGEQSFWATEGGTFALDAKYSVEYDTALIDHMLKTVGPLDVFSDRKKTLVLVGDSSCLLDQSAKEKVSLKKYPRPEWVESAPEVSGKVYAIGISEEYQYEVSSWLAAESAGLRELARSLRSKQKSVLRSDEYEQHDVRVEEVNVVVRNVAIEARWKDGEKKIYYVLMSQPLQ